MAVTGLPDAQPDHALIMAKFAYDCNMKMHETTRRLMDKLGEGTEDLVLRIGLHSGPVTAGILKGEKSRFQLFGDTVNTASRMESNSKRNQIHCSKASAELLVKQWPEVKLFSRGMIPIKGKGEMQTYWAVVPTSGPRSTVSSTPSSTPSTTSDEP